MTDVTIDELYSEESEADILGIMMIDEDKVSRILTTLNQQDFCRAENRLIFKAIETLYKQHKPTDIVSVSELLKFNNELDRVGGRSRVNDLALGVSITSNWEQLCKVIVKYSKKRQLMSICRESLAELADSTDVDEVAQRLSSTSQDILTRTGITKFQGLTQGIIQMMDNVDRLVTNGTGTLGLPTGFSELDFLLSGLCKGRFYLLGARPSMGKALSLDTKVLTPTGWIKNRNIKLGDTIIGRDGKPTKVVGVYPQGITNNYTLTLKDGRTIDCCEDHEWTVYSSKWGRERTFTTKELYNKLQSVRYKNRISLPRFTGDYGIEKDFIIPPYVMGVLIGDGCLTRGMCYCKPDVTILNKIQSLLPNSDVHFGSDNKMVYITNFIEGLNYIKKIGLNTQSYNKFIPNEYFHSSKEQRQELFKGLMDTDGYHFNTGWEYSTTSKQLALDVQQLAWSLGYCAKVTTRIGKYKKDNQVITTRTNYRVFITSSKPLTIVDIQPTKPFETQCIHVDNKDHLFVIEDYIVTHNSALAQQIAETVAQTKNVLFFSLEMGIEEYTQRSIYRRSGYNQEHLTRGIIPREKIINAFAEASVGLEQLHLQIVDDPKCTLETIERNIQEAKTQLGSCDLVVVDYIQLMKSSDRRVIKDYDVVTDNSQGLKQLARKYDIPILGLCQLSRALEARQDKRPILADLRDSGSLEQDADCVMFVHRPEVFEPTNANLRGMAELIIAKNRQGARGRVIPLVFNGSKVEFKEVPR